MNNESRIDELLSIEAMADSIKEMCIRLRLDEEKQKVNSLVLVKGFAEQENNLRNISMLRKNLFRKKTAA